MSITLTWTEATEREKFKGRELKLGNVKIAFAYKNKYLDQETPYVAWINLPIAIETKEKMKAASQEALEALVEQTVKDWIKDAGLT